ncbi:MAG: hypothetical protein J0I09_04755 [Sphingobacteriia bacterium]|nr:hypothetical protein [Sphingobacteriia bacterium]
MKILSLLICVCLSANIIAQHKFVTEADRKDTALNTFTNIPIQSTSGKIDVFMESDKPKADYYRVRLLEVSGAQSENELLMRLKDQAQILGFDAIQIVSSKNFNYLRYGTGSVITQGVVNSALGNKNAPYYPDLAVGQSLTAIAIKYKSNMGYVNKQCKSAKLQINDSAQTRLEIDFTLNNTFAKSNSVFTNNYWLKNISLFKTADVFVTAAHDFLKDADDEYLNVTGKIETDSGNIRYKCHYYNNFDVKYIEIKIPNTQGNIEPHIYNITYEKDAAGLITKRYISSGRKRIKMYVDVYNYDELKRCSGFTRFDAKTNKIILTTEFNFYSIDDLPPTDN